MLPPASRRRRPHRTPLRIAMRPLRAREVNPPRHAELRRQRLQCAAQRTIADERQLELIAQTGKTFERQLRSLLRVQRPTTPISTRVRRRSDVARAPRRAQQRARRSAQRRPDSARRVCARAARRIAAFRLPPPETRRRKTRRPQTSACAIGAATARTCRIRAPPLRTSLPGETGARARGHLMRAIPMREHKSVSATGRELPQTRRHPARSALDAQVRRIVPTLASRGAKEHRIHRQPGSSERGSVVPAQVEERRMVVRTELQRARLRHRRFVTSRSSITRYSRSEPTNIASASAGVHTIGSPCRFSDVFSNTASPVSVSICSSNA